METIFINTHNSKTNEPNRFRYSLTDKLNKIALANMSVYYTWKNIKSEYNNNEVKITASTCDENFDFDRWIIQY